MLDSFVRPLCRCFGRREEDGLMWHMDLRPHATGDFSIAVVQANSNLEDQGQVYSSSFGTYVGVYDGHGGPQASRFISDNLIPYLHEFASKDGRLSADVIKKAIRTTEDKFFQCVKGAFPDHPEMASVGSCCLVGAISGDVLYVANLGDSRAVLGRQVFDNRGAAAAVIAERLSTDHNVAVEDIRKELVALHPDDSHIVVLNRGVWRLKGIIQVSRSIGDVYLKKPEFSRNPIFKQFGSPAPLKRAVMTAEPSIQGIAQRLINAALYEAARKREVRYEDLKRIEKGFRRHFHDDITVIVMFLDDQKGSRLKGNAVHCTSSPLDIFSYNLNDSEERIRPES